ncbi:MAG: ribonuclease HII [Acidobacteria bacterium]|nr:ribonuclease HII [Acidobacteriota bacterium]
MSEIEEALNFDKGFWDKGFYPLAGVDEVGRGALFGPVVAAAVVILRDREIPPFFDLKMGTAKKREELFEEIVDCGHCFSVGVVNVEEIDKTNILQATLKAMETAVEGLKLVPSIALVDGNRKPQLKCRAETIVKGDKLSLSIGAASIVAKVFRDRMITELDEKYPGYGLKSNKGYGTKDHLEAIYKMGPTPLHRKTFKPLSEIGGSLWR